MKIKKTNIKHKQVDINFHLKLKPKIENMSYILLVENKEISGYKVLIMLFYRLKKLKKYKMKKMQKNNQSLSEKGVLHWS